MFELVEAVTSYQEPSWEFRRNCSITYSKQRIPSAYSYGARVSVRHKKKRKDDNNQHEGAYRKLVHKIMDESKDREDKLMNLNETTIKQQTEAITEVINNIKELNQHVIQLSTWKPTIEFRVEKLECDK
ncbi:MAG TPA: hypothetical protein VN379_05460 [Sporomusa sp.]|nr:hypothetical protein [Sporomusa sp.]